MERPNLRRCYNDQVDQHARMWIVHKFTTTEDEGCKTNTTRDTPFWNGIPGNTWWYWFKWRHLEVSIWQGKRLEVRKAQGLTLVSYNSFHTNLHALCNQHNYITNHVWNSNETWIQASKQFGARVLARGWLNVVYNIIPKFQEWLTISCAINVIGSVLPRFHICRGERLWNDYIKIANQKHAWQYKRKFGWLLFCSRSS